MCKRQLGIGAFARRGRPGRHAYLFRVARLPVSLTVALVTPLWRNNAAHRGAVVLVESSCVCVHLLVWKCAYFSACNAAVLLSGVAPHAGGEAWLSAVPGAAAEVRDVAHVWRCAGGAQSAQLKVCTCGSTRKEGLLHPCACAFAVTRACQCAHQGRERGSAADMCTLCTKQLCGYLPCSCCEGACRSRCSNRIAGPRSAITPTCGQAKTVPC